MNLENIHDYGLRRQGLTATVRHLQKQIERVERTVSHPAQRYKLLTYIIGRILTNDADQMAVLEGKEPKPFVFRFEKGKLITSDEWKGGKTK